MKKPPAKSTQQRLAKLLCISRTSLRAWAQKPGAPKGWKPEPWRKFIAENGLGLTGNRVGAEREKLLCEMLTENLAIARIKRAQAQKMVCAVAEVDALLLHLATVSKATLYSGLANELPAKAEGKTATEIRVMGRELADRICEVMSGAVGRFRNDYPSPAPTL